MDHSIRVHHRNYLENVVVVEGPLALFCLFHPLQQVAYYSLQHETRCCLYRVLPADDPHDFTLFGWPPPGGNSDEIDCVFGGRFAQLFDREEGLVLPVGVNSVEEVEKLGVGVGVGWGEVYSVKGFSELVLEGQSVVGLIVVLPSKAVLLVENFDAVPVPAESLPAPLFRKDQGLEPVAEERLLFGEVDDVEPYLLVLVAVAHPEVKPLVVPPSVYIVLQNQIVGVDAYLGVAPECVEQVATLEVGVEEDRPRCHWRLIFYLGEVPFFALEIDPRECDEGAGKVVLFHTNIEAAVEELSLVESLPKVLGKRRVFFEVCFPDLFLDLVVLKKCILNGEETMRLGLSVLGIRFGEGGAG